MKNSPVEIADANRCGDFFFYVIDIFMFRNFVLMQFFFFFFLSELERIVLSVLKFYAWLINLRQILLYTS